MIEVEYRGGEGDVVFDDGLWLEYDDGGMRSAIIYCPQLTLPR